MLHPSLKHISRTLSPLAVVLFCASAAAAQQVPQDDTQIWNDVQITVPVNKKVDLTFNGTLRIGRDVTHPVDERAGVGLSFKVGKYVTLAPNYTYIAAQPAAGRKSYESRLSFAATLRKQFEKLVISDRNTFERRMFNSKDDVTRYRNRLQFEYPVKIKGFGLRLFASDEVFYDWGADAWVRNRITAGGSRAINRRFTLELYYMRQNDGRSRPGDLHVIGSTYRIRF
jgi:hypothetical protein